jgi:acid phosphatase class B
VLIIIGISNASNQINKPLPIVGVYFEKWFENIV